MAWSASKIFTAFVLDVLENTAAFDLGGTPDTFKAALFDNSITPSQTVSSANSAYGAGVWASGGVSHAQWAAAGVALGSPDAAVASNVVNFDATDTASGAGATLVDVYGVLVYDDTLAAPVADQGVCYNYLGGVNSVTGGLFTVVWNASGIFYLTL